MITYSFTECFTKQFTKNYEYPDFGYFRDSVYQAASPPAAAPPPPHVPPRAARPAYSAAIFGEPEVWGCVIEGLRSKRALKHFEVKRRLLHEK